MGHHLRIPDSQYSIGALMTPYPVVIDLDTPLEEVAERLAQNDITGAPVVDHLGRLVGVISAKRIWFGRSLQP